MNCINILEKDILNDIFFCGIIWLGGFGMKKINEMSISDRQHLQLNRELTDIVDCVKTNLNDSFVGAYYIGDAAMSTCFMMVVYDRSYVNGFDIDKTIATGTGVDIKIESVPYDFFFDEKRALYSYDYPYESCLYYGDIFYDTESKLAKIKDNLVEGSSYGQVNSRLGMAKVTPPIQYIRK